MCFLPVFSKSTENSGWGHTNYKIQVNVVILKVTTRFFQQQPWIIGKIIMIVWGHTCPIWTTRLLCVLLQWSWLNSKQPQRWITGTFIMIVLWSHMFSAKFTTVVFGKNDYDDKNFHRCFLILYYNKFPKVCGHTPTNYYSKWKFTTINSMSSFVWPQPQFYPKCQL